MFFSHQNASCYWCLTVEPKTQADILLYSGLSHFSKNDVVRPLRDIQHNPQ